MSEPNGPFFDFFTSLVGYEYEFYGVDNNAFCIGINGKRVAFEAMEDEQDGYRSNLGNIVVSLEGKVFFAKPIAQVMLEEDKSVDGWRLRDVADGHVWLEIGTDYADDYYPTFVFRYEPKALKLDANV